jgi:prepilin-type N-terminal cleavage/methylation domain-containing protein
LAAAAGFTLIEMMVVVVLVGVLATLATYGVMRYVRSSKASEAYAMVIDIKAAEEAVRDETFQYVGLSEFNSWHPSDPPGNFKKSWQVNNGAASGIFQRLGVISNGPVYYTYSVVAGPAGQAYPQLPSSNQLGLTGNASAPFYIVAAKGDLNGDGQIFSYVIGHSLGSDLYSEREGE